jgi:hypothetical protein
VTTIAVAWKGLSTRTLEEALVAHSEDGLVRIPYRTLTGEVHNVRVFAPSGRCWWERRGLELIPFGLETLRDSPHDRGLLIAEGESDALALRRHFGAGFGYDVLGVPGARTWRADWARFCEPYAVGYVFGDGDEAGRAFAAAVQRDVPQVRVVRMPDGEDVRSLVQREGPGVVDRLLEEADRLRHEQVRSASVAELWGEAMGRCATFDGCVLYVERRVRELAA